MPFPSVATQFKKGQVANPNGRPRGSGILQRAQILLGSNSSDSREIAEKLIARAKKGNLQAINMLLDRLDGPLVRKLEIDQKVVVGIVAHFEVACREIVGEESAAKIVARTIELLDAGTDPAGSASEPIASVEAAQPQPDQAVRDVPQ